MTIREFSEKYNIPYSIVRKASFKIDTNGEITLFYAVLSHINDQIKYHQGLLAKYKQMRTNMTGDEDK